MSKGMIEELLIKVIKCYPPQGVIYKDGSALVGDTARFITDSSIINAINQILTESKKDLLDEIVKGNTPFGMSEEEKIKVYEKWTTKWLGE